MKILVTDGGYKNSLAVVRSLGKEHEVTVLYSRPYDLTVHSKFVSSFVKVDASTVSDVKKYGQFLVNLVKKRNFDFLLPVGLKSNLAVSYFKEELEKHVNIVISDWSSMRIAYNKDLMTKVTRKLNIPVPETIELNEPKNPQDLSFPLVLKASDDSGGFVRYASSKVEFTEAYNYLRSKSSTKIIVQEYIVGEGCGFFGVFKNGRPVAVFMHRRVKEFPITGGPSAVAESYYNRKLLNYGLKLARYLKWSGPIMFEFKHRTKQDEFYLIEANPKLWGSLDLTITAGVDVPKILLNLGTKNKVEHSFSYKKIRFMWVFPDEILVMLSNPKKELHEFVSLLKSPLTVTNIDLSDPVPMLLQLLMTFKNGIKVMIDTKYRFPHGNPEV